MPPLPKIDDRWLWLAFGTFIFFAARGIRHAITDVVQLTEVEAYQPEPKNDKRKTKAIEDDISLTNLKTLAFSPNSNIASAATSLIIARFLRQTHAYRTIVSDIEQSHDEALRARARHALAFLRDWPIMEGDFLSHSPIPMTNPHSRSSSPSMPALEEVRVARDGWADAAAAGPGEGRVGRNVGFVPSVEDPVAGWTDVPRERPMPSGIVDEARRRRSRREAMVLREAEGGVEEGDIIRPSIEE